jgi:hypothetical protein
MISVDDVRAIALQLPGVAERPSYGGRPSWRAGPRMFAWVRDDPEALVVWVESVEDKEALIASAPDRFFTTDHYENHPVVLVSLVTVTFDEADELVRDSWCLRAPARLVKGYLAALDPG